MRRARSTTRKIDADPKYRDLTVARFVNYVMRRGKKSAARGVIYDCFDLIKEKAKEEPLKVFETALKNVGPVIEIKARRIGGANYQVPVEVRGGRKQALAFRWIIAAAKKKKGERMAEKLAKEIMDAAKGEGGAIKKRNDVHKMAEANKAFAHFA